MAIAAVCLLLLVGVLGSNFSGLADESVAQRTNLELVDWSLSHAWMFDGSKLWLRVLNYNQLPIANITFAYETFAGDGRLLNHGKFTIHDAVAAGMARNFTDLSIGPIDRATDKIVVRLVSLSTNDGSLLCAVRLAGDDIVHFLIDFVLILGVTAGCIYVSDRAKFR